MKPVDLKYSPKNIPIHSKKQYRMLLIQKTKMFLRNLGWKVHFFLNPPKKKESKNYYNFKSTKNPPSTLELKDFESKILDLIQNIKFKKGKGINILYKPEGATLNSRNELKNK